MAEEPRLLAGEGKTVESFGSQPRRGLEQVLPRGRLILHAVGAVQEELHVQIARKTVELSLYARQFQGTWGEGLELPVVQVIVERGQPLSLARGVFGVRRDQVVSRFPRGELGFDLLVEVGVRRGDHGLDLETLALLELPEACVEGIVHRPADQQYPQASAHKSSTTWAATASPSFVCSPASRWMPSTSLETMTVEASKNSHPRCSAKRS